MSAAGPPRGRQSSRQRGVGLIELMIGVLISMLMVLIIYQVYVVSEGQKRTITAGSDAQQNASYGLFLIGQDLMGAGQVISASTTALAGCAMLRPIPAIIAAGATDNDPDSITVLYGGSSSLSTPAPLLNNGVGRHDAAGRVLVAGPLGFSPNDVIVAVQGTNCTLSIVNAGGVSVAAGTGIATISHTLTATPGNNSGGDLRRRHGVARQSGAGGHSRRAGAIRSDPLLRRSRRRTRCRRRACCRRCSR